MIRAQSVIIAAAVLLSATAVCVPEAHAEAGDAQRTAAAQALYDEAVKAIGAKDYATACPKLEEVVKLVPEGVGAKLSLASCYEDAGRLASAWTAYVVAEAAAAQAGQEARRKVAKGRAEALRPKLATLTVVVPEAARALPGLAIERDGIPVGPAQWGSAIPVDRGEHVVVVTAPSRPRMEKRVAIDADGAASVVDIGALIEQPAAEEPPREERPGAGAGAAPPPQAAGAGAAAPPRAAKKEPPPVPPASFTWGPQRIAGVAAGGLGLVAVGVGSYFGVSALQKNNESNDGHCRDGNICDATGVDLRERAMAAGTASTALFIAGGVALAGGVVLFATAPSGREESAARVIATPAGLVLDGRW